MLALLTIYSFLSLIAILAMVALLILVGLLAPKLGIGISLLGIFSLAILSFYQPASETELPAYGIVQLIDTTSSQPNPNTRITELPSSTKDDRIDKTPSPKKSKPKPKDNSPQESLPQPPEAIPDAYEATFPPLNPHVKLQIKGIDDKTFIQKLGRHIGYEFARKGTFLIEVEFTGKTIKRIDPKRGETEWNYSEGSIVIKVDQETCISNGRFVLPPVDYSGKSFGELQVDLEKRKLLLLKQNIRELATKLRACIPK